jgi:hypothetical protein
VSSELLGSDNLCFRYVDTDDVSTLFGKGTRLTRPYQSLNPECLSKCTNPVPGARYKTMLGSQGDTPHNLERFCSNQRTCPSSILS